MLLGVFVLLGTVPAAGSRGCVPGTWLWLCTPLPTGGLHYWARRVWVMEVSSLSDTARADRQNWLPDAAKPTTGGAGVERKSAAGWQKLAGCSSHRARYKPGLTWHRLWPLSALAPLWDQEGLVSLLTWAPAASALKQLLALVNPTFE